MKWTDMIPGVIFGIMFYMFMGIIVQLFPAFRTHLLDYNVAIPSCQVSVGYLPGAEEVSLSLGTVSGEYVTLRISYETPNDANLNLVYNIGASEYYAIKDRTVRGTNTIQYPVRVNPAIDRTYVFRAVLERLSAGDSYPDGTYIISDCNVVIETGGGDVNAWEECG